jgi:hypothetical protein
MRIFVVRKDSNLKTLLGNAPAARIELLQRFNPHLDLKRLTPGAVIVVPEAARDIEFPSGDPKSIGTEAMESFIGFARDGLAATGRRLQQAAERAKTEDAALQSALKSRAVQAALEKDAELKNQAEEALRRAREDSRDTAAEAKNFDALFKSAQAELAALAGRLG